MKRKIVLIFCLLLASLSLFACKAVESITLDVESEQLWGGDTLQIVATIAPEGIAADQITWSSDNESVATVDQTGLVTAIDVGTAVISATAKNEVSASCTIDVVGVKPTIAISSSKDATVDLLSSNTYVLAYEISGTPNPSFSLTCDKPSGWSYNSGNKTITFTQAAKYTFTITAKNAGATVKETFVVTATGSVVVPAFNGSKGAVLFLEGASVVHTFAHSIIGTPTPSVSVTCNKSSGFSLNANNTEATFTQEGVYEFTFTGSNSVGSFSEKVRVTVVDGTVVWSQDFNTNNDGVTLNATDGKVEIEGNALHISGENGSGENFAIINPSKTFSGIMVYTAKVKTATENTSAGNFAQFFVGYGTPSREDSARRAHVSLAQNNLAVRQKGGDWAVQNNMNFAFNQYYDVIIAIDHSTQTYDVFVDGEYIVTHGFREEGGSTQSIGIGCGNAGASNFYVDDIAIYGN